MWQNYLRVTMRTLWKSPLYSLINIGGLAISLAIALLMILWVWDEVKYDRFHEKLPRINRLYMAFFDANNNIDPYETVSYPLAKAVVERIPEVEAVAIISENFEATIQQEDRTFKVSSVEANSELFDVFSFPLIAGNSLEAEENPNSVVVSESLAERLFGTYWRDKAIGNVIRMEEGAELEVEAVMRDIPKHSTLQFDMVTNLEKRAEELASIWGNHSFRVYPLLQEGADQRAVEEKISKIYINSDAYDEGEFVIAHPMKQEYLYARFDNAGQVIGGRIEYVRLFLFAALFLLVIACINFVNMATARSSTRAKEVGVRKTVGARKSALISQFMTEAGMVILIATAGAILLAELLLPSVCGWTEKTLFLPYHLPVFWLVITGLILFTTALAGAYPAFVLSSFRIRQVFQSGQGGSGRKVSLRQGLVIAQFVLAMLLMVGATVVQQQTNYIRNKNLGLDRSQVLFVELEKEAIQKYNVLKAELLEKEGIASVTSVNGNPLDVDLKTTGVHWEGKLEEEGHIHFNILMAEHNFLDAFSIPLISGRDFKENMRSDSSGILLNESAVEVMGLKAPLEGQMLNFWGTDRKILGVVKDFHITSLYSAIPPMLFSLNLWPNNSLYIHTKPGQAEEAIQGLQATFAEVLPGETLAYQFLDEAYNQQYKAEELTGTLASYFAWLSIFLSCLGLLGLATFVAERRTKEIGIRKVLGASVTNIVRLLSTGFLKLVVLGLMVAIPFSWYLMQLWLGKFEYHIDLQWWFFAGAAAVVTIFALATVGLQGLRAAIVNPVESLRNE